MRMTRKRIPRASRAAIPRSMGQRRNLAVVAGAPLPITLRRILVPISFTTDSLEPMEYAVAIARAHRARIILFHVTKPISFCVDCGYGPVNRQLPDEAQTRKDRARLRKTAVRHLPPAFIEDA